MNKRRVKATCVLAGWAAGHGGLHRAASVLADAPVPIVTAPRLAPTDASRRWAALLLQIFEVDPLVCPRCAGPMRIVAFITHAAVIDQILTHLRTTPHRPRLDRTRGGAVCKASLCFHDPDSNSYSVVEMVKDLLPPDERPPLPTIPHNKRVRRKTSAEIFGDRGHGGSPYLDEAPVVHNAPVHGRRPSAAKPTAVAAAPRKKRSRGGRGRRPKA